MSVSDGKQKLTYDYHADGQIASANYGNGKTEDFLWDGLALVRRGGEQFINEPHVGGGNPVVSSKGVSYFNDILGTTVGFKSNGKYSPAALSAFGERLDNVDSTSPAIRSLGEGWFTGKPYVEGLGHVFLMRNYRASLAKWQTADPLGYPDGWNQLAYCGNNGICRFDFMGARWGNSEMVAYYFRYTDDFAKLSALSTSLAAAWWAVKLLTTDDHIDTDVMGLTDDIYWAMRVDATSAVNAYVKNNIPGLSGHGSRSNFGFSVDCKYIVFALGSGTGSLTDIVEWSWHTEEEWIGEHLYEVKYYEWAYSGSMDYFDSFRDPVDVLNLLGSPNIEVPGGVPYDYGHSWKNVTLGGNGKILKLIE
jgi:RHS repeat-associated protein